MTGPELGGRLFALEAVVVAVAAEITAAMPDDRAQQVTDAIKVVAADMLDDLVLPGGAQSPLAKQISQHCLEYADTFAKAIAKERAKLLTR
jgi:hypothetical protein